MSETPPTLVAISYSREDQRIIALLVTFLKAALAPLRPIEPVFWDADLEFGKPWQTAIEQGIARSEQLFVFWCAHAAASEPVAREYRFALEASKLVVPVLLDRTPMPPELGRLQGVNLIDSGLHQDWQRYGAQTNDIQQWTHKFKFDQHDIGLRRSADPRMRLLKGTIDGVAAFAGVFDTDAGWLRQSVGRVLVESSGAASDAGLWGALFQVNPRMFQVEVRQEPDNLE